MSITSIFPSVHQLPLHLPEEQIYIYTTTLYSAEEVLKEHRSTTLTEYFEANTVYGKMAQEIKYEEFSMTFVWNAKENVDYKTQTTYTS